MEGLDAITQDLKLAVRSLSRQKMWTAVALITLALGIGANSALFTIVNAVLLRPLPYPHAERVVSLSERERGVDISVVSNLTFTEWLRSSRSFSALAAYGTTSALVRGPEESELVRGLETTASYFAVMAVTPARGRTFTADEDRPGGAAVVVLSEQLWRRLFGADSALIGRTVLVEGKPQTVIGIMPWSFTTVRGPQYWVPMRIDPAPPPPGTTFFYSVVGRAPSRRLRRSRPPRAHGARATTRRRAAGGAARPHRGGDDAA